jgi:hypothetical protein
VEEGEEVTIAGGDGLDLGPFRISAALPMDCGDLYTSRATSCWAGVDVREGSCTASVVAVLVSMGGGRIGTATMDEEVEETVVVDLDEDVDAVRSTCPGSWNAGYDGVGVDRLDETDGTGDACIVAAMRMKGMCYALRMEIKVVGVVLVLQQRPCGVLRVAISPLTLAVAAPVDKIEQGRI